MPGPIVDHLDYIRLLLNTSRTQGEALLDTITPEQIKAFSQICRNLKKFPLDSSVTGSLKRNQKLFKTLRMKKPNIRIKGKLISRHRKFLISILMSVKPVLIPYLEHFEKEYQLKRIGGYKAQDKV